MKNVIIIPTYNEGRNIKKLVQMIFDQIPNIHILVVDDSSPDGTAKIVKGLQNNFSNLQLLVRGKKEGLGLAYVHAYNEVLRDKEVVGIVMMDADFSHDLKYLPSMLYYGESFDVVIGSRYIKGGKIINWELWRRFLSRFANFYVRMIARLPIKDCTSGFNFIKADTLRKIDLSKIDSSGYAFLIELKYLLWETGAKIKEFPIIFRNRTDNESKITNHIIKEGILAPWKILLKMKK